MVNSMSWSQSHVSHCRVLPLDEFTVTIPEPRATLQCGAWLWNRDSAGCNSIRHIEKLKIVFRHILFMYLLFFINAVWALTSSGFRIVSDTLVSICDLSLSSSCSKPWDVATSEFSVGVSAQRRCCNARFQPILLSRSGNLGRDRPTIGN